MALAEEGWTQGPLVEGIVRRYFEPIFCVPRAEQPDCLVLGCTHFPVLQARDARVLGEGIVIVDSAETTADAVRELLQSRSLGKRSAVEAATMRLLATDGRERFARVGGTFFGQRVRAGKRGDGGSLG